MSIRINWIRGSYQMFEVVLTTLFFLSNSVTVLASQGNATLREESIEFRAEYIDVAGLPKRLADTKIAAAADKGSLIFLGENVLRADDPIARGRLCRLARLTGATVYASLIAKKEFGEVLEVTRDNCADGRIVARAGLGVPGRTAPFWPLWQEAFVAQDLSVELMICLEGFSPWRWRNYLSRVTHNPVVILANDSSLDPLPFWNIRAGLVWTTSNMFSIPVYHSSTDRRILVLTPKSGIWDANVLNVITEL
jgi:hypothetical protein